MENKINLELSKLQDELSLLEGAVKHISKAEQISTDVVDATKAINNRFGQQLQSVMNQYNDYLDKSYTASAEKLEEVANSKKEQIDSVENLIANYKNYVDNAQNQSSENFSKGLEQYQISLDKLSSSTESKVNTLTNESENQLNTLAESHKAQIEKVETVLNQYYDFVEKTDKRNEENLQQALNNYTYFLSRSYEETKTQVNNLAVSHQTQIKKVEGLIDEFLDVALITTKLSDKIESVNFPAKLGLISSTTDNVKSEINSVRSSVDNLEIKMLANNEEANKQLKAQNKQIDTLKILLYFVILISLGLGVAIFLKF